MQMISNSGRKSLPSSVDDHASTHEQKLNFNQSNFGSKNCTDRLQKYPKSAPILQTHLIAESPLPSGLFLPATFFASARLEFDTFCTHKAILHPNRSLPF